MKNPRGKPEDDKKTRPRITQLLATCHSRA